MNNLERLNNNDMDMKKAYIYIIGVALLTACSGDINYEMPDNYTNEIAFAVSSIRNSEVASRADDHTHNTDYDPAKHPTSLGVYGYADAEKIYDNALFNYNTSTKKWDWDNTSNTDKKQRYWEEFSYAESIDFIGYLYGNAALPAASISKDGSNYTLTFPAALAKPVLLASEVDAAPLVCCKPVHTSTLLPNVTFEMDRTLTGYTVWFSLGEKMNAVRDFKVTAVKVSGSAPKSGTVQCVYNSTGKAVTWTGLGTATDFDVPLEWNDAESNPKSLTVNSNTDFLKWGESGVTSQAFFAIPSATFEPVINVTYDVVLDDPNGDVITRKGVVSNITINKTNFSGLSAGATGKIHPIKIKIVPSYLYVLADKDQASGYLLLQ